MQVPPAAWPRRLSRCGGKGDSRAGSPGFGSVLSALFGDGVQSPLARDALELVRSAVLETDPRSGYEILNRARDQTSLAAAWEATRAPPWTAMPPVLPSTSSH